VKRINLSLAVIGACALAAGCGSSSSKSSSTAAAGSTTSILSASTGLGLRHPGQINFCSDMTIPPLEFVSAGGQPQGSDIDLGTALGKQMGLTVRFTQISFDGLIAALQANQCDAILSSMYDQPDRAKVIDFIDYQKLGNEIVVKHGNTRQIASLADLAGLTVGVEKGTSLGPELISASKKLIAAGRPAIKVVTFPGDTAAFQELATGQIDAFYTDAATASYDLKKDPSAGTLAGPQQSAQDTGIGVRKDSPALRAALGKALRELQQNGDYLRILTHWNLANAAIGPPA